MERIKTEKQYKAACTKIEELLKVVGNDTPTDDKNFLELDLISDLVADYEEEHFPIESPSLVKVIRENRSLNNFVESTLMDAAYDIPNEETLMGISEARSGKYAVTINMTNFDTFIKSVNDIE